MRALEAERTLAEWDCRSRRIFTKSDLRRLFPDDKDKAFSEGLRRLVTAGVVTRPAKGVYLNARSRQPRTHLLEEIAVCLRRGEYNYISLESALSEHGAISQIPVDRITVMTTGRKGEFRTPYGTIEFTHTDRKPSDILDSSEEVGRPLRLASPESAFRDLKRVGRNVHLVDEEALSDIIDDWND